MGQVLYITRDLVTDGRKETQDSRCTGEIVM